MAAIRHFGLSKIQIFSSRLSGEDHCASHTKFYQNPSNGFGDITFKVFQNGGRPPSWILKN